MDHDMKRFINILTDKGASIGDRDDAAMDLSQYDNDDAALKTLVLIAQDKEEDPMILNSCGESIGSIWVKKNSFDKDCYANLSKAAQYGIYYVLREDRPEWLESLEIKWK